MRTRMRFICGVVLFALLLSAGLACAAMEGTGERRVTLDLRNASVVDAFGIVFRDTGYSYTFTPNPTFVRLVTVNLSDVEFSKALDIICDAAGLTYKREGTVFKMTPKEGIATIGGAQVPVLGATWIKQLGEHLEASPRESVIAGGPVGVMAEGRGGVSVLPGPTIPEPPSSSGHLVDLVVQDMPLRQAIAQFSKASGADVVVHEAVSKDIRVSAKAYMVDAWWLLNAIVDQAGLRIYQETVYFSPEEYHAMAEEWVRVEQSGNEAKRPDLGRFIYNGDVTAMTKNMIYHIVPKIELKVTGPGVPGPRLEFRPLPTRPGGFLPLGEPPAPPAETK